MKGPEVTPYKLRHVFNWLRNRKWLVSIEYDYNCSMGYHDHRSYTGVIDTFKVTDFDSQYKIEVTFTDGKQMEEYVNAYFEFGYKYHPKHLILKGCNGDGTYDYFEIHVKDPSVEERRS